MERLLLELIKLHIRNQIYLFINKIELKLGKFNELKNIDLLNIDIKV